MERVYVCVVVGLFICVCEVVCLFVCVIFCLIVCLCVRIFGSLFVFFCFFFFFFLFFFVFVCLFVFFFFFQAEDGIRDHCVTGVQTCALPILTVNDYESSLLQDKTGLSTA